MKLSENMRIDHALRWCLLVGALCLWSSPARSQTPSDNSAAWAFLIGGIILLLLYFIPTFIAFKRRHPNRWVIFLLNTFLGGTGIIWFGCIIWAMMAVHRTDDPNGTHGGESGLNLTANDIVRLRIEPPVGAPPPLPVAQAAPAGGDVLDRLERLKRLHDSGAVDDQQFRRMRDTIIASV